jgi:hypothetical protein
LAWDSSSRARPMATEAATSTPSSADQHQHQHQRQSRGNQGVLCVIVVEWGAGGGRECGRVCAGEALEPGGLALTMPRSCEGLFAGLCFPTLAQHQDTRLGSVARRLNGGRLLLVAACHPSPPHKQARSSWGPPPASKKHMHSHTRAHAHCLSSCRHTTRAAPAEAARGAKRILTRQSCSGSWGLGRGLGQARLQAGAPVPEPRATGVLPPPTATATPGQGRGSQMNGAAASK